MQGLNPGQQIQHHNIAFVNDTDGHIMADRNIEDTVKYLVSQIQTREQIWNNTIEICGASPALHKTTWQMAAWEVKQEILHMLTDTTAEVRLSYGKGGYALIPYTTPDKPNAGLAFRLCIS